MRVAHVITRFIIGGVQENTLFSCMDLVREYGDDVLLITGPPLGPEGSLMEEVRASGVPVCETPAMRRNLHPWLDFKAYWEVKRAIREFQPDVVHTHSAKAGVLGRMAACKLKVPAVIHGVHGAPFYPYQNCLGRVFYKAAERWAAKRCHAFISVADAMTDIMVSGGVAPRERFTTIYSGMDVEPFLNADEHREAVRKDWGVRPEHVVIGKIARLFKLKGHEYVVRAASQVVKHAPNVRFVFVGDGLLTDQIKRHIRDAGLEEHFIFTGLVQPSEIPRMIGGMDILVHASLREGLARVLPQALIAGKGVISYDIDGAREVVINGETGILLPPQTVDELADAMIRLVNDPALRKQYGEEGRRRFTDQFRHQTMTRHIRALYERVLAESR